MSLGSPQYNHPSQTGTTEKLHGLLERVVIKGKRERVTEFNCAKTPVLVTLLMALLNPVLID